MKQVEYSKHVKICKCVIILAILAYRPLYLKELGAIADLSMEMREEPIIFEGTGATLQFFPDHSRRHNLSCPSIGLGFSLKAMAQASFPQVIRKNMARLHIGL